VPFAEERRRALPVIEGLRGAGAALAIDTYKPEMMDAALDAGAMIVNDVFGLAKGGLAAVVRRRPFVILGHSKGEPADMNRAPDYADVVAEVRDGLAARLAACIAAGVPRERIALDPGLGFGKKRRHNLALLHGLGALAALGRPICVGASRKLAPRDAPEEIKLASSVAAALLAVGNGAHILRVHDVAATRAALAVGIEAKQRGARNS
jgi:dihydropteroate synthase